ncbi:recombinase family protein [Tardiphaga sp. vice278]|uniref:recombinase family protein n=1 Tax=Tardiphaga sp. vice278 TaxID=2592815 RepID=UPI001FED40B2|nr:recombinase family protein [Tardiphaga sp. vice278]
MAYLRTSSASNVGADKDSDKRQRAAIDAYARREGLTVTEEFYDADVSGADPIESRPGFSALLDRIEANGVRTVIVEDASRFARQLIVQEAGIIALIERGVRVLTASGDDLTVTDDPFKVAMRQIAGVFAQLEKARLVGKLKTARDRKRAAGFKVEGRKTLAEIDERDNGGAMVALARRLRRARPKGGKRSLREIASELEAAGFISHSGKRYAPTAVARMLGEI